MTIYSCKIPQFTRSNIVLVFEIMCPLPVVLKTTTSFCDGFTTLYVHVDFGAASLALCIVLIDFWDVFYSLRAFSFARFCASFPAFFWATTRARSSRVSCYYRINSCFLEASSAFCWFYSAFVAQFRPVLGLHNRV